MTMDGEDGAHGRASVTIPSFTDPEDVLPAGSVQESTPLSAALDGKASVEKMSFLADHKRELEAQKERMFWEAFFVVMPLFCGYATLFSMQSEVKSAMGISDDDKHESHVFGVAVSMLYIGNLVFRLGHNFVFWFGTPRIRVLIAMGSMMLSMALLSIVLFFIKEDTSILLIFLSYGLGGVAVGTFESNILSTISVLHPSTKLWAIIAMPVGITTITIGGFFLLGVPWVSEYPGSIHVAVGCYCLVGIGIFMVRIFWTKMTLSTSFSIRDFFRSFIHWREWLWAIKWHCMALTFDMFCVSLFSPGVILYMYNGTYVNVFGYDLNRDWYIAIYNTFFFVGDSASRKIWYHIDVIHPFLFLILSAFGATIGLLGIPEIAPLCGFLVAYANGSMYAPNTAPPNIIPLVLCVLLLFII
eukprot:TRINITY_DN4372_c0_g1_i3.p1 TRINITY_DN4372_c0_g1~~TRINITY_DN4372_c0_g1_i3.p1  ORF type:complete len:433 (+),score=131.63 TRINITY_DN4372_c0_g1_i3:58-1299(+)